jgi:hypothetical protein
MMTHMTRITRITAIAVVLGLAATANADTLTSTGWFSDVSCAATRVKNGLIGPSGAACVTRCLDEGKAPAFVSEKTRTFYEVKNHPSVKDDLIWYVEVTGTVDAEGKTITIQSVKRLQELPAQCGLKKKPTANAATSGQPK